MAGDWIKWVKGLSRRREVIVLARKLNMSRREAACACMEMWEWADDETANGHVHGATRDDIDLMLGITGFAVALEAPEVGWLKVNSSGISFPRYDRHNGESAKTRATESSKKRRQRDLQRKKLSPRKRDKCPEDVPKNTGPEREETRGEERRARGEKRISNRDRTDRPIGADQSPPLDRSPVDFLDLSGLDWHGVLRMAEAAAKRVPPKTDDDRRAWLKYAVIAETTFSESWLIDAAEAVVMAKETKQSRQAHFVAVLKSKAAEAGTDEETFLGIFRRIEIPVEIWKSDVLKIGGRK